MEKRHAKNHTRQQIREAMKKDIPYSERKSEGREPRSSQSLKKLLKRNWEKKARRAGELPMKGAGYKRTKGRKIRPESPMEEVAV